MNDKNKSKVILLPCTTYREASVYEKLKRGMELLGGFESLIGKQESILLKPNLLKKSEPDRAVITHPAVVGMFGRLLRENGYENIRLADSSGTGATIKNIRGTGMDNYLEKYNIPALDFSGGVKTSYPEGVQAKEFILAKELTESDCVISLCKMKTHALERITGAVKNSYGFIYGLHKAQGHTKYPSADSFARMLIDLNRLVKPRLYIMDGVMAMEGNGPGSGDPTAMNVLLMSTDPVALDSVFCRLIHLKPQMVPTCYHGEKMGLGTWKEDEIEVVTPEGVISMEEAVAIYGNPTFNVDRQVVRTGVWESLAKTLNIFQKKPYIDESRCVKCGVCVESCPVPGKAVDFKNGRKKAPVYNYKKCIRCFCCQEMCPEKAIKVK